MASFLVRKRKHATLTGATVDTVKLQDPTSTVEVVNRDAALTIYFTVNGTDPTVAGDDTIVLPPSAAYHWLAPTDTVKLISSGAAAYSVQGVR